MIESKIVKLSVLTAILAFLALPAAGVQNPVFQDSFEDGNFTDSWNVWQNHRTAFGRITDDFAKHGENSMRVHIGKTFSGDFDFRKNISQFKGFRKNLSFWIRPASTDVKAGYGFAGKGSHMKVKFDAQGRLKFQYNDEEGNRDNKRFGSYEPNVWYKISLYLNPSKNTSTFHIYGENGREEKVGPVGTKGGFSHLNFGVGDIGGPTDLYLDQVVLESSGKRKSSSIEAPDPAPNNSVLVVEPEWRKTLRASSVQKPVLATSKYGQEFKQFINDKEPEKIYSLGEIQGSAESNITSLKPSHLVPVFFPNATSAVSLEGKDREGALKAAQYAYERGIPVVFEDRSDIETQDYSEEDMGERYLENAAEEGGINHIVLADVDAPSSALAPRYASRRDAYLAVGGQDETPEEFRDRIKEVIETLESKGEGIGSFDYLKEGVYLTIFGAPHKKIKDPVESIELSDEEGGKKFSSDMVYTDLNQDGRVDFNYGRMPKSLERTSKVLETDVETEKALVAGEYGRSAWPQVLAYRGGGMWSAKEMNSVFKDQGLNTTFLAEKRVSRSGTRKALTKLPFHLFGFPDPEKALNSIDRVKNNLIEGKFKKSVRTLVANAPGLAKLAATRSDKVAKYTGNLVSSATLKNVFSKISLALFRALAAKDTTRLLQTYLENDITPKRETLETVLSKQSLKEPADTFLKAVNSSLEPYTELNASLLDKKAASAGKIYFVGVSNDSHWILPNKEGDKLKLSVEEDLFNQYNGSRSYRPSNISGFVYDGSSSAAAPGSIKNKVLSGGAEGFLGFTTDTYFTHSEDIGQGFFQKGFTRGKALKKSINDFVEGGWSFDIESIARGAAGAALDSNPTSHAEKIYKTVRNAYERYDRKRTKTHKSAVLYGEPEEKKDPKVEKYKEPSKRCGEGHCNYTWNLETSYRNVDGNLLMDKDLESIETPQLPNLFFHKVERIFPEDTELKISADIEDTSFVEKENRINGVLPNRLVEKKIYTLPDGRKKLVVKHMALQYTSEGVKVFDNLEIKARAEQESHVEVSTDQVPNSTVGKITAAITSGANATGRVAVTVANQTWKETRTSLVNFTAGQDRFSWDFDLEPGRYRVSVVADSEKRLGPISKDFEIKEPADPVVTLEVKEVVEESERFNAVVTASNRGGLPAEIDLEVEGSESVQPDFFETSGLKVNLSGGETVRREIEMRAFRPGNASMTLISSAGNESESFKVKKSSFVSRMISSVKQVFSENRWFENFESESRHDSLVLKIDRPEGFLKVQKTPKKSFQYMYRGGAALKIDRSPEETETVLETPEGEIRILEGRGGRRTTRKGNISLERLEKMEETLGRGAQKLLNRYYLERGDSLPGGSILEVIDRWV